MPVLFIHLQRTTNEQRAEHARTATTAVSEAAGVAPKKIQIFFRDGHPGLEVHMLATPHAARITQALTGAGYQHVTVVEYAPDHTAKNGNLRKQEGHT